MTTTISNNSEYVAAVNQLKVWDYEYFQLNSPTVPDVIYDRLYDAVQRYEQEHPSEVLVDSSTQVIRTEVKNGHRQVARRTPMLSTQKAQTVEQVEKWMKQTVKAVTRINGLTDKPVMFSLEWKFDGLSVSLVYHDGKLIEASYGKGTEGNDCLATCLQVASIPNEIPVKGRVEVRGEMLVPFEHLDKTGYKNCRSAASGILADTETNLIDCLDFHPYWVNGYHDDFTHDAAVDCLSQIGSRGGCFSRYTDFKSAGSMRFPIKNGEDIHKFLTMLIEDWTEERPTLSFPVDGLVIKVADRSVWDALGATEHHPKYSIAYKFAAETAETTITRIDITVGRTGKRTPVAYYEPVVINGATYQKASIGSEKKLAELDLHVGDRVVVSLRNDVIPHIDGKSPLTPQQPLSPALSPEGEREQDTTEGSEEPAQEAPSVSCDMSQDGAEEQVTEGTEPAQEVAEGDNPFAYHEDVVVTEYGQNENLMDRGSDAEEELTPEARAFREAAEQRVEEAEHPERYAKPLDYGRTDSVEQEQEAQDEGASCSVSPSVSCDMSQDGAVEQGTDEEESPCASVQSVVEDDDDWVLDACERALRERHQEENDNENENENRSGMGTGMKILIACIAVLVVGGACVAGLGAALFLVPLLAGGLKA